MGKIEKNLEPVCKRCGKALSDDRREYCAECSKKKHFFTQGKALFVYQKQMKQSMYRFKYGNRRQYAEFFAQAAAENFADWVLQKQIEAVIPIPMYCWKKRRRGYNQAEEFARAFGRIMGIPVDTTLVKRIRNTVPQKELDENGRRSNLKNAFHLNSDIVKYKKVLLVDDIYTTGSTMDAVAEILLSAGVKSIYFICISIGAEY